MNENYNIRRATEGDAQIFAYIQTESWKAAFQHILEPEDLKQCTNLERATAMYQKLLDAKKGNGYILEVEGKPHCIAWWDAARDQDMTGYAELICIHSLQDNWRKGYGSKMMEQVLSDMEKAGYAHTLLWVFEKNSRARKFYEAKGFHKTEKEKEFCGEVEVMYEK